MRTNCCFVIESIHAFYFVNNLFVYKALLVWAKDDRLLYKIFITMQYLCISQQPDNSDLFKGLGPTSPRGSLWNQLQRVGERQNQQLGGSKVWRHHEVYSEPVQISKNELFGKIVNDFQPWIIFAKFSILNVYLGSEYISAYYYA